MRLKGLAQFKGAAVTAVALATAGTALVIPSDRPAAQQTSGAEPDGSSQACLIVDTDVGLDDFRAVAALLPWRNVRAVVVTEGIASVRRGATAASMFMASGKQTPPVITGLASPAPPNYDWLPAARAGAERINNFLAASVPFAIDDSTMNQQVRAAVYGCSRVQVLVLGPWTSFNRYLSVLGSDVRVVASGRPYAENNPDNFNCEYDLAACQTAASLLRWVRSAVFVDLPAYTGDPTYDPTEEMVAQYETAGVPGLLRAALQLDPSQWLGTRLWDDAATLYLLQPQLFAQRGKHVEPWIGEAKFRELLVAAVNGG